MRTKVNTSMNIVFLLSLQKMSARRTLPARRMQRSQVGSAVRTIMDTRITTVFLPGNRIGPHSGPYQTAIKFAIDAFTPELVRGHHILQSASQVGYALRTLFVSIHHEIAPDTQLAMAD